LLLGGCARRGAERGREALAGTVRVDGSSTVFPITEAVAEEFGKEHPGVKVLVGISGTGGGFKKFVAGETDINDASRPIEKGEEEKARAHGISWVELPVAYDGLAVVVHPSNDWVDCLTVEELRRIWRPGSDIKNWKQIRPGFPDRPLTLYGPGHDSGTFDYFTEVIVGKAKSSRADYSASEDDNVLVQGISRDPNALGYFGLAYFEENARKLKLLGVDGGEGCVKPSRDTVREGKYRPLSRPLFIYVNAASLKRPEVREFVRFYLQNAPKLVPEVGYIPLPEEEYRKGLEKLNQ
jgi:phosphate transport system substrate-binding protein